MPNQSRVWSSSALQAHAGSQQGADDGNDRANRNIDAAGEDHNRLPGSQQYQRKKDPQVVVDCIQLEDRFLKVQVDQQGE